MSKPRILLDSRRFKLTIERLCYQLIEDYQDFSETCLIGIQPRGVYLADRIVGRLHQIARKARFEYGKLDITFYRDDFRIRANPLVANKTELDFLVENKQVILIDDVLYTGRTVQAALTAIQHYGRPSQVALLALIDRRFNRHLPIQCNYTGLIVDALDQAYVEVKWEEHGESDSVILYPKRKED